MDSALILEKLKEIFKLVVNKDADVSKITLDTMIANDLGVSSVAYLYLVYAIKTEFGIDMDDVDVNTFIRVGDVVNYIGSKLK